MRIRKNIFRKVQSMFRLVIEDKDEKIFTHKNFFIQNLQVKCNCESNLQNIPDFPIMHTARAQGSATQGNGHIT